MRFYGERSLMWARESDLEEGALTSRHIADLQAWGRTRQKCGSLQFAPPCALWDPNNRTGQLLRCIFSPSTALEAVPASQSILPWSPVEHWMQRRPQMIEAIHYELECALDDPAAEVARLLDMQKLTYSPLSSICAQCLEEGGPELKPTAGCSLWWVSDTAFGPKWALMLPLGVTNLLFSQR